MSSLNYKKQWGKASLSSYFLTGEVKQTYFDTEDRTYQWDGSYQDKPNELSGEISDLKSILEIKDEVMRANIYGKYEISHAFSVSSGLSFNRTERSGEDELDESKASLEDRRSMTKTVSALNLNYHGVGSGSIFYKNYQLSGTRDDNNPADGSSIDDSLSKSFHGFGLTYRYSMFDALALNASFEKSVRLPEVYELLGDGIFVRANPLLEPEKSNNLNLGLKYDGTAGETMYVLESNLFYRQAENYIRFIQDEVIKGVYENVKEVEIKGIELSSMLSFSNSFSVNTAITYQDMINKSKTNLSGGEDTFYGSRVPNEPYLFANMQIAYSFFDKKYNQYSVSWNSRYVYEYFLEWESAGDSSDKQLIDSQLTHAIEASASFIHQTYNVSFAVDNLLDEDVYDNYNIQKPGRSYALKLRYNY